MKTLILFVAALFFVGCAPRLDYTFSLPADTNAEDYHAALSAAAQWHSCNIVSVSVLVGGNDIPLLPVLDIPNHPDWIGDTYIQDDEPQRLVFRENLGPGFKESVIAHEMGHAFGLGHTATGLMYIKNRDGVVGPQECEALRSIK